MTYDPATIYSFVRIRSLPRCSLQREWSTASKKKGEKKNVPLYIHIVKGVNRRFWRVDADGWAAPAIPVISTYVRTYVAGVCSISCISWRGAATCICSCFMRANYYTPLWRATRVENETERGGRGLRIRRSKGISSKYLRASINILHTSASPSPLPPLSIEQLFRQAIRKLVSSKDRPTIGNESCSTRVRKFRNWKIVYLFLGLIGLNW